MYDSDGTEVMVLTWMSIHIVILIVQIYTFDGRGDLYMVSQRTSRIEISTRDMTSRYRHDDDVETQQTSFQM